MIERNDHHTNFMAREHNLRPESAYIRSVMIARGMAVAAHKLLHKECAPVPVPGFNTLQYVANRMPSGLYVLDAIDEYCGLVEQSNKHPRIKPIEVSVNNLSIEAVRAQIPYIIDGMPSTRRIVA